MKALLFCLVLMLCMFAPHLWPLWVFPWFIFAMLTRD